MADILFGEYSKKVVRLGVKLMRKKLGADVKVVEHDLKYCPNPCIRALDKIITTASDNIKPEFQRKTVRELGKLALWIIYKDTAYRDVFFWILYKILKLADKLLPLVEPYVKPPNEWYPNMWEDSRQKTREMKEKGEIPRNAMSPEETIFTPAIQDKRHKKILAGEYDA